MPAGRRAALRVQRQHPRALRAVAPHRHGCAQRHGRSRGRGCTAQQLAGCADGWCCEHRCHEGSACAARGRCVCAMAQAARVEPAPALHVGAGSIDFQSTLQRMLPKELILILSISKLIICLQFGKPYVLPQTKSLISLRQD